MYSKCSKYHSETVSVRNRGWRISRCLICFRFFKSGGATAPLPYRSYATGLNSLPSRYSTFYHSMWPPFQCLGLAISGTARAPIPLQLEIIPLPNQQDSYVHCLHSRSRKPSIPEQSTKNRWNNFSAVTVIGQHLCVLQPEFVHHAQPQFVYIINRMML